MNPGWLLIPILLLGLARDAAASEPPTGAPTVESCEEYFFNAQWWPEGAVNSAEQIIRWITFAHQEQFDALAAVQIKNELFTLLFSATAHQVAPRLPWRLTLGLASKRDDFVAYRSMLKTPDQFHPAQVQRLAPVQSQDEAAQAFALNLVRALRSMAFASISAPRGLISFSPDLIETVTYDGSDDLNRRFELRIPQILTPLLEPAILALVYRFVKGNASEIIKHHRALFGWASDHEKTLSRRVSDLLRYRSELLPTRVVVFSDLQRLKVELLNRPDEGTNAAPPPQLDAPVMVNSPEFDAARVRDFVESAARDRIGSVGDPALKRLVTDLRAATELTNLILLAAAATATDSPDWGRWSREAAQADRLTELNSSIAEFSRIKERALDRLDELEGVLSALEAWVTDRGRVVANLDTSDMVIAGLRMTDRRAFEALINSLTNLPVLIRTGLKALDQRHATEAEHAAALGQITALIGHALSARIAPGGSDAALPPLREALRHMAGPPP